ncbi:MAG: AsmA family protein [Sphingobacteriia bacterium]|nr:AsmA family protein [Sphingobacteriia bacterium]
MKLSIPRSVKKGFKVSGIVFAGILALMFLLPILFPGFVSEKIKSWAKSAVVTDLNFSKTRLSFFKHFPSLTLTLYDCTLKGSDPFPKEDLINAEEISFGINLASIFSNKIKIDEIYLNKSNINVLVNAKGQANYNVYKSDTATVKNTNDSSTTALKIEHIQIDKSNILYNDQSIPININAKGVNYLGKGDLSKAIFDLASSIKIDSFDLDYGGSHYIGSKKLKAKLITKINTHSLAFVFEKNEVVLNSLPFEFNGKFEFLKDGYSMDFKMKTTNADLYDVLGALPPEYTPWFDKIDADGSTDIKATLKGDYLAAKNKMPDFDLTMDIVNGSLNYNKAPVPITNLLLKSSFKLPNLTPDSLVFTIDTLHFNQAKSYADLSFKLKGLSRMFINTRAKADLDIEKLAESAGIKGITLKGDYKLNATVNGVYATRVIAKKNAREKITYDTVVSSIPHFNFHSQLQKGFFKYRHLPEAIENISATIDASCADSNYHHALLIVNDINAKAVTSFVKGYIKLGGTANNTVDAGLNAELHLNDLQKVYPLDSIALKGNLLVNLLAKGNYNPAKKMFPVTVIGLKMNDGSIQTKYYPHPIEKITIDASVNSAKGSLKDLSLNIKPVSFLFEGQPFFIQAGLNDFSNIHYDIKSNGILDIGKIYKVFSRKGLDVSGYIKTNLALRGTQNDAMAKRIDKLFNAGIMEMKNIKVNTEYFPQPFYIQSGSLKFEQDKIWLQDVKSRYGASDLTMNGYIANVVNYALQDKAPLEGNFNLASEYINVNEFLAFAGDTGKSATTASGVFMVPKNLNITVNAAAKKVQYGDIMLQNFKGQMLIDTGTVALNQTGFDMIGANASMNAKYASINARKALFEFDIKAKDFNIKRAYKEIKLFHDMASAAAYCEGIVSLDYSIKGRLNENMYPVMPSLSGGGNLTLGKVKVKGFKLFSAVSKATGKDSLNNPDLSAVTIKSTIANNILTIEKTKMRVFGFRPRLEGQVSLDGKLNLKGRVGLPPLGIFGIPFSVTGTQSNPQVKLKRGGDGKLEETDDKEDN